MPRSVPGPPAPCALSVRGLTAERRAGRSFRVVLEDISLSAQPGEITAVLGAAGAGKTSLLAAIGGLLKASRGAVLAGGVDVTRARPGGRNIGFLPPGTMLDPALTVGAAPARAARGKGRTGRGGAPHDTADLLMQALGLAPDAACRLADASHGQALAALTAARLLAAGQILLVDEAGMGLEELLQDAMLAWLREQAGASRTILIGTRSTRVAMAADHLVLLHQGRVLQSGAPASIYAEPRDATAALMTGPANILRGTLRQKLPGGFIWVAGGQRFTQADHPGQPSPPLGSEIAMCLRPDHVATSPAALANRIDGMVEQLTSRGGRTEVLCATPLGQLRALTEGPPALRRGMAASLSWAPEAAFVMGA